MHDCNFFFLFNVSSEEIRTMAVACQTTILSILHALDQETLSLSQAHTHTQIHFIIHWPYIEFDIEIVTSHKKTPYTLTDKKRKIEKS